MGLGLAAVIYCGADPDAHQALAGLAKHYEGCASVEVRVHAVDATNGVPFQSAGRHVVMADGRLASWFWIGFSGAPSEVWTLPPSSFKFRDHRTMIVPHTSQTYMQLETEHAGESLPEDLEAYAIAPWPRLSAWCSALGSAQDLVFFYENGVFNASSRNMGLTLRWDELHQLQLVRVSHAGGWREYQFEGSGTGAFTPPSRSVQRIHAGKTARPELVWTYDEVRFNLENEDDALATATTISRLDRYDVESGDVFKPDGTLRYNEPELLAALALKSSWGSMWAKSIWAAVALAIGGSCYLLWRRGTVRCALQR